MYHSPGLQKNKNRMFFHIPPHVLRKWIRSLVFTACVLLILCSCEVPFENKASRDFIIRTGDHYATPRLYETFKSNKLEFKATFDESAMYDLGGPALQSNKNKLMGFSDCSSAHHENSARFAWQWYNERLEIYAYCYVDSVRIEEFIGHVNLNEENLYGIIATENEYQFFLNGEKKVYIDRLNQCDEGLNYMLYPYFGGSEPAPHDVRVEIQLVSH